MEIKIENYLDNFEIKEIVIDELRLQIRKHFICEENSKRLLSNLSYQIVWDEIDKIIPNSKDFIVDKVHSIIKSNSSYNVFRDKTSYSPQSLASQYVEQAVKENKELIQKRIIDTINQRDFNDEVWSKFESLAEEFTSNIYNMVDMLRSKNEK